MHHSSQYDNFNKEKVPKMSNLKSSVNNVHFKNASSSFTSEYLKDAKHNAFSLSGKSKIENHVAIILGYYDGHLFIKDQLYSIFEQSHKALHVFLCDDQSNTPFSLDNLQLDSKQLSKLSLATRPKNIGLTKNFLNPLANITEKFDYYAFSDQDDIWHKDKLEKAIAKISKVQSDVPALYCARTEIVDATAKNTRCNSPLFSKPPSFANALVQSIGGGNTMVFNRAAKNLIIKASLNFDVLYHDWWCYQIITGVGGYVFCDPEPCLKYRQHDLNLVGANNNLRARFIRIRKLLQGRFRAWTDINLKTLLENKHLLTKSNQKVLENFIKARQSNLLKRIYFFKKSGIYRQTLLGNFGLLLGILLNKV